MLKAGTERTGKDGCEGLGRPPEERLVDDVKTTSHGTVREVGGRSNGFKRFCDADGHRSSVFGAGGGGS